MFAAIGPEPSTSEASKMLRPLTDELAEPEPKATPAV